MARNDWRSPYVGEGPEGCQRSAEIDRTESDIIDIGTDHWHQLRSSAARWERQAEEMTAAKAEDDAVRQNVLDQWGVFRTAQEAESAAHQALETAKRLKSHTGMLAMEARYQLTLTVPCTYHSVPAGTPCPSEPGVNLHRYPRQCGVRDTAVRAAAKRYLNDDEKAGG